MDDQSTPAYKDSMAAGLSQTPGRLERLERLHLDHVEGLRALAALVVYVNHAYAQSKPMGAPPLAASSAIETRMRVLSYLPSVNGLSSNAPRT